MRLEHSVDLSERVEPADLPEWMDEPCSYVDFRACLIDLGQLNRMTLAYRPTLDFLERLCRHARLSEPRCGAPGGETQGPLRIVDVGCGGGDMLRRIERWAKHRRVAVELTGIDLNPYAARAAREFTPPGSAIRWVTGDAFAHAGPVDVVLSSLFTHHLSEPEIVRFLAWSEAVARRGWFINDLCREAVLYRLFGALAAAMRWHRFVRHDGPVSFRRSFREQDWQRMTAAAGIDGSAIELRRWMPARLCVGHARSVENLS